MKKAIALISLYSLLISNLAWSVGKIQNEDVKSLSDLTSAGGTAAQLINTTKIYDVTNAQQLSTSIANGTLGGASGGSGGIELLNNPGFEFGAITNGWSTSGGTAALVASGATGFLFGTETASWTASASGQTFSSTAYALNGLASGNCAASLYYTYGGTSGDYIFEALDGSSNVLASKSLTAQSSASLPTTITWVCNSSKTATIQWVLKSTVASPSIIYFDNAHLGSNNNLGTVQQALDWGALNLTAASGCNFAATGLSSENIYVSLGTASGCNAWVARGNVTAPATNSISVPLGSVPPGTIRIHVHGLIGPSSNTSVCDWQMTDGTTTAPMGGQYGMYAETELMGSINYTTPGTHTITFQAANNTTASCSFGPGVAGRNMQIDVDYFPASAQSAFTANSSPANWSGTSSLTGSTTSTSASDPGSVSGSVSTVTSQNISCSAASGFLGVTCTLPSTGSYLACYNGSAYTTVSGDSGYVIFSDGSNNPLSGQQQITSSSVGQYIGIGSCAGYNATSTTATFKLRGLVSGSGTPTGFFSMTGFSIVSTNTPVAAPIVNSSITTKSTAAYRVETYLINGSGSSFTMNTTSDTGATSTRTGVGRATITFGTAFSSAPICTVTENYNATSIFVGVIDNPTHVPTTTNLYIASANLSGAYADGDGFNVVCMGPK